MFISSSTIYSFILRDKTYMVKDILDNRLKDIPYLMIQPIIENLYFPGKNPAASAYSTNAFSLIPEGAK